MQINVSVYKRLYFRGGGGKYTERFMYYSYVYLNRNSCLSIALLQKLYFDKHQSDR